ANRSKLDEIVSLENYIFIIARNECFRLLKHKAILISVEDGIFDNLADDSSEPDEDPFIRISRAIDLLPPQQKRIFKMAKLNGLSHEKISKELNLSPSTVNNHITAAFRSIRNYIHRSATEVYILTLALLS